LSKLLHFEYNACFTTVNASRLKRDRVIPRCRFDSGSGHNCLKILELNCQHNCGGLLKISLF